MCLNRVIGRKILTEDMPCYGIVKLTDDGDRTVYQDELIVADSKSMIYANTDNNLYASYYNLKYGDNEYASGFHRFIDNESAEQRKGVNMAVRKYIIPRGTEIVIGAESEGYVVVTPTLSLNIKKGEKYEFIQPVCDSSATENKEFTF